MIQIQLNGEPVELAPCTVAELVASRGWEGRRIAVERNGAIVPRSRLSATPIQSGDRLEIVVAVGGG